MSEGKGTLYKKGFKRFTQQKLKRMNEDAIRSGGDFCVCGGRRGPFIDTWVFRKHADIDYNEEEMVRLLDLMFAPDTETVRGCFPKVDGKYSLEKMRELFGSYVIIGKFPDQRFWAFLEWA